MLAGQCKRHDLLESRIEVIIYISHGGLCNLDSLFTKLEKGRFTKTISQLVQEE